MAGKQGKDPGNEFNKKVKLSKYMSRELSLFCIHVWNETLRDQFDQYVPGTNLKNVMFLRNEAGIFDLHCDLTELDVVYARMAQGVIDDPSLLDKIVEDFYLYWEKLWLFISGKEKMKEVSQLREYYENWVKWWAPMAYLFVIPDQAQVPEALRARALKVREETQSYSDADDKVVTDFIKEYYPQYAEHAFLVTPEEAYRMEELTEEEIEAIKERAKGHAVVTFHSVSASHAVHELQDRLGVQNIEIEKEELDSVQEIRGAVASRGRVEGRVRLVLKKADLTLVEPGEIMVTFATAPEYVPAMKKSAAIVTDEGGVVCHAAIVSRELGIPCVVGTKIGTQVLKTGDLVEVDATNGVVKILKRA